MWMQSVCDEMRLMFATDYQPALECPHTTIIRLWNLLDNFPRIQCLLAAEHNLYNSCYYLARYHITLLNTQVDKLET